MVLLEESLGVSSEVPNAHTVLSLSLPLVAADQTRTLSYSSSALPAALLPAMMVTDSNHLEP